MNEVFGDPISVYTRAQALEDGQLVDVSETAKEAGIRFPVALTRAQALEGGQLVGVGEAAKEAGIRFPVALTRAVWESCVVVPVNGKGRPVPCQDERGRLWDVLSMTRFAIRLSPAGHDTLP